MNQDPQKREGLMGCITRGAHIEFVIEILKERMKHGGREVFVRLPTKKKPEWVSSDNVIEIQRIPQVRRITKAEMRECNRLFDKWTKDGGKGAELLTPAQIERFAELSELLSQSITS